MTDLTHKNALHGRFGGGRTSSGDQQRSARPGTLRFGGYLAQMARILVADDVRPIRMLIRRALELAGHDVVEAADGDEALSVLIAERPAVAILDVIMPGMSGFEVCRAARSDVSLASLGIIILSGNVSAEQAREAGADRVFTKPFSPKALLDAVADVVAATDAGFAAHSAVTTVAGV